MKKNEEIEIIDVPEFLRTLDEERAKKTQRVVEEKPQIPLGTIGKDRLHNLDDRERREVLHYTPTGEILGELLRRSEEYEKTINNISKLIENMKIWA